MQNGFVESFNGQMRDELLNETIVLNLTDTRVVIAASAAGDKIAPPHSALDYQPQTDIAWTSTDAIAGPAAREESSVRRAIAQPPPSGASTLTELRSQVQWQVRVSDTVSMACWEDATRL
ncbi:hypothetical protein B7H23_12300 [Notoacmeibacter marinus]|uniref:Integrase catalytic domain-containing protein n=1 Tax=Notoacmeibacter marinus TaxID=1876515 RepID=A0A231UY23_9HYPH|nr:hypothetical protein B7H23_12300 [Notoacmeibacter marinus]